MSYNLTFVIKRLRQRAQNTRGFTLVDTILMMVVVGIGVSGLMAYFISVNRQAMNSNMTVAASVLAQERIDQVVAAKVYQGYNFVVAANYPNENLGGAFAGYSRTTQIQEVNPADLTTAQVGSGLKRIDITVQWSAAPADRVILTTLVTQY